MGSNQSGITDINARLISTVRPDLLLGSIYPLTALLRVFTELQFGSVPAGFPDKCVAHARRLSVFGPISSTGGGFDGRSRNGIVVRVAAGLDLFGRHCFPGVRDGINPRDFLTLFRHWRFGGSGSCCTVRGFRHKGQNRRRLRRTRYRSSGLRKFQFYAEGLRE